MMRRRHSSSDSLPLPLVVCHSATACHSTPFTHRTVITRPTTTAAMVGHQVEKGSALSNRSSRRSMMSVCVCNVKIVTIRALIDARIRIAYGNLRLLCTAHDLGLNCNRNNKYKFSLRAPTTGAASSLTSSPHPPPFPLLFCLTHSDFHGDN